MATLMASKMFVREAPVRGFYKFIRFGHYMLLYVTDGW